MLNIEQLLETSAYDFLRTNEHLKDRILFLCLSGSRAYGTNIEGSDTDIRGVALPAVNDLIGLTTFDQFEDRATDTVVYSLSKFILLASNCNPNIIEMLFCKPEHYYWVSPLGKKILENRHLFLSKRVIYTFGGYAHSQLNRLENALIRNGKILNEIETEDHVNRSVKNAIASFTSKFNLKENAISTIVDLDEEDGKHKIMCNFNLTNYPLSNLKSMIEEMTTISRQYTETVGRANAKKDDLHLNKHMMHLIRLYLMCREILKDSNLHTFRVEDRELLMSIRMGEFRSENGGVKKEFYELLHDLEEDCKKAAESTSLPKRVNIEKISEIVCAIYSEGIFNLMNKPND